MPGREMGPYLLIVKRMTGKTKEVRDKSSSQALGLLSTLGCAVVF